MKMIAAWLVRVVWPSFVILSFLHQLINVIHWSWSLNPIYTITQSGLCTRTKEEEMGNSIEYDGNGNIVKQVRDFSIVIFL